MGYRKTRVVRVGSVLNIAALHQPVQTSSNYFAPYYPYLIAIKYLNIKAQWYFPIVKTRKKIWVSQTLNIYGKNQKGKELVCQEDF